MVYIVIILTILVFFTLYNINFIKKHKNDKQRSLEVKFAQAGLVIFFVLIVFLITRIIIGVH